MSSFWAQILVSESIMRWRARVTPWKKLFRQNNRAQQLPQTKKSDPGIALLDGWWL